MSSLDQAGLEVPGRHLVMVVFVTGAGGLGMMMAFKLLAMAQQRWRKLNGAHLLALVRAGVEFEDGKPVERNDNDQMEAA